MNRIIHSTNIFFFIESMGIDKIDRIDESCSIDKNKTRVGDINITDKLITNVIVFFAITF